MWASIGLYHYQLFEQGYALKSSRVLERKICSFMLKAYSETEFQASLDDLGMIYVPDETEQSLSQVTASYIANMYCSQIDARCFHDALDKLLEGTGVTKC